LHEAYKPILLQIQTVILSRQNLVSKSWGLGTSSTLINNIAQWLQIDALRFKTVLAVAVMTSPAQNDTPIVYHLDQGVPSIEQVTLTPIYKSFILCIPK
jgi:hypothetical protein